MRWVPARRGRQCHHRMAPVLRTARASSLESDVRAHAGAAGAGALSGHRRDRLPGLPFPTRLESPRCSGAGGMGGSRPGPDRVQGAARPRGGAQSHFRPRYRDGYVDRRPAGPSDSRGHRPRWARAVSDDAFQRYRTLSDEDLASIVVFLRSLPPVRNPLPTSRLAFPVRYLIRKAPQPITQAVPPPDVSTPVKRGAYLATIAACTEYRQAPTSTARRRP